MKGIISRRAGKAPMIRKESGDCFPVPFNKTLRLQGLWLVDFETESTAGGGADLDVGSTDVATGFSAYEPRVRAYVESPQILWLTQSFHGSLEPLTGEEVLTQSFLRGYDPFTKSIQIFGERVSPDPYQKILGNFFEKDFAVPGDSFFPPYKGVEGLYRLSESPDYAGDSETLKELEVSSRRLFSPRLTKQAGKWQVLGGGFAARAKDFAGSGRRFVLIQMRQNGWLIDSENPSQSIRLEGGWYVFQF